MSLRHTACNSLAAPCLVFIVLEMSRLGRGGSALRHSVSLGVGGAMLDMDNPRNRSATLDTLARLWPAYGDQPIGANLAALAGLSTDEVQTSNVRFEKVQAGDAMTTTNMIHLAKTEDGVASRSVRLEQVAQTALIGLKARLQKAKATFWKIEQKSKSIASETFSVKLLVLCVICCLGVCCIVGEHVFREQDREKREQVEQRRVARGIDEDGGQRESIVEKGKKARGEPTGKYQPGDFTRGIIQAGKDGKERGYRPGDFTRGLVKSFTQE